MVNSNRFEGFLLTYKEIRILLNDKIAMVIVFLMPSNHFLVSMGCCRSWY